MKSTASMASTHQRLNFYNPQSCRPVEKCSLSTLTGCIFLMGNAVNVVDVQNSCTFPHAPGEYDKILIFEKKLNFFSHTRSEKNSSPIFERIVKMTKKR